MGGKKIKATDSLGSVEIPSGALYRAQTQRALDNFRISGLRLPALTDVLEKWIRHTHQPDDGEKPPASNDAEPTRQPADAAEPAP